MNRVLLLTITLGALGLAACASTRRAPAARGTGFVFETLHERGIEYRYAVYAPRGYDPARPWPLVVFLHGAGESGTDGTKMVAVGLGPAILRRATRWPAIVVFPQKPSEGTEWEEHEPAVLEMVARARQVYTVDPQRIYLTGLSQGGHGTWVLGARHPDLWAALAPVCGYVESRRAGTGAFRGTVAELAEAVKALPIWALHGDADDVVPASETQAMIDALRAAGGTPKFSLLRGVNHNAWDPAYNDPALAEWLFAQRRSEAGR
jgi:predicted peptidase